MNPEGRQRGTSFLGVAFVGLALGGLLVAGSGGPNPRERGTATRLVDPDRSPIAASSHPGRDDLLVIDFLAFAGEAVASDPIPGSPDAQDLVPFLGDPTSFGTAVNDSVDSDPSATSRCGVVGRVLVAALARALNSRLPLDQQIDPASPSSRSLLHWSAAEGFASLRVYARPEGAVRSCADAGQRF